jgi:hypothetical protein
MPDPVGGAVAAEVALGGDRFYAVRAWTVNGITYTAPLIVTEYEDRLWGALESVYAVWTPWRSPPPWSRTCRRDGPPYRHRRITRARPQRARCCAR